MISPSSPTPQPGQFVGSRMRGSSPPWIATPAGRWAMLMALKAETPVNREHLAGDEARAVGAQERHGGGNVLGGALALDLRHLHELTNHLVGERALGELGPDVARGDRVARDVAGAVL